jgi:hypothetical protein
MIGLALQLGGFVVVALSLLAEWRAESSLTPLRMKTSRRGRENPWSPKGPVRPGRIEPSTSGSRYMIRPRTDWRELLSEYKRAVHGARAHTQGRALGEAVALVASDIVNIIERHEKAAAADWERQRELDEQMRKDLAHLFNEQARLLVEQQNSTRFRVRFEAIGLALSLLGTVIGTANAL